MTDYDHKAAFYEAINKQFPKSRKVYAQSEVQDKIETIIRAKLNPNTKDAKSYYLMSHFKVMEVGGINRLITIEPDKNSIKYVCAFETMFDDIDYHHKIVGHGDINKTTKEVKKKFANISDKFVKIYIELCIGCQQKNTKAGSKKVVVKPIVSSGFMSRGQLDLIDYQSMPDGLYKWIMHYQDHHNKFSFLYPLTCKEAKEVALNLIEIFTLIGAPCILQMDNGREFVAKVIQELKLIWKDMVIVHGRPRHPQSQGSIERANADVKNMLSLWMKDNKSKNWALGLKFVQMSKNNSYHRTIKCTPYFATFGREMNFGVGSTAVPKNFLTNITSEEELEEILKNNSPERIQAIQEIEEIENLLINPSISNTVQVNNKEDSEGDSDESEDDDDEKTNDDDELQIGELVDEVNQKLLIKISEEIITTQVESLASESLIPVRRGRKRKVIENDIEEDKENENLPLTSKQACFEANAIKIRDIQNSCSENLKNAAEAMAMQHIHKLGEAKVGDTVQVSVPDVDRGPADPVNILAYIRKINNHKLYQLATKHGIIKGWHARNSFQICKQKLIKFEQLDLSIERSLREINGLHSISGGQGFMKCNCIGKCQKNCSCRKNGVYCNSKCHRNKVSNECLNTL